MATESKPTRLNRLGAESRRASRRVKFMDRLANLVIRMGGVMVILAVMAIFVFIGKEALPLFLPATFEIWKSPPLPPAAIEAPVPLLGSDEYETYAYWLGQNAQIQLVRLEDGSAVDPIALEDLEERTVTSAYRTPSRDWVLIGTDAGRLLLAQLKFRPDYTDAGRTVAYGLEQSPWITVSEDRSPIRQLHARMGSSGLHFAALCEDNTVHYGHYEKGDDPHVDMVEGLPEGTVTRLAIDGEGEKLFAATSDGRIAHYYLQEETEQPFAVYEAGGPDRNLTSMEMLLGENSLVLGYEDGSVEQWFGVREGSGGAQFPYQRIRGFEALPGAVTHLVPSGRDRGFLAAASEGSIRLYFSTSEQTILRLQAGGPLRGLIYSPKLTSILALTAEGHSVGWQIRNRHPEVSWRTLFGNVWYEGYPEPDYVWQSTGGSDEFESKFSLVPLTFGTLKAAIYGLLFAIPLAVLAAIYTSQFMSPRLRTVVKPAVEIMAALPSVVIGFLAGLWLAPNLEHHVVSVAAAVAVIPVLLLGAVLMWSCVPLARRSSWPAWTEMAIISALVLTGLFISTRVGPWLETLVFRGDLRQWIFSSLGQPFEQRNSIVIGFAMGFAVIPIIYTISEDALSNVPQHFVSGSLALGASRWQTATRIILPTASPGIFSAVMVGFGRAVGETMIVLMATGNTPILSMSPFNGMRTLSANIAVEIPEAPLEGTLYRVLFLTAILLFLMTFAVNTVAEIIRHRLRERYKAV